MSISRPLWVFFYCVLFLLVLLHGALLTFMFGSFWLSAAHFPWIVIQGAFFKSWYKDVSFQRELFVFATWLGVLETKPI